MKFLYHRPPAHGLGPLFFIDFSYHSLRIEADITAVLHLPTYTLKSHGCCSSSAYQHYIRFQRKEAHGFLVPLMDRLVPADPPITGVRLWICSVLGGSRCFAHHSPLSLCNHTCREWWVVSLKRSDTCELVQAGNSSCTAMHMTWHAPLSTLIYQECPFNSIQSLFKLQKSTISPSAFQCTTALHQYCCIYSFSPTTYH